MGAMSLNDSIIADTLKHEPKYREALTAEQGSFEYSDQGYEYLVNYTKLGSEGVDAIQLPA